MYQQTIFLYTGRLSIDPAALFLFFGTHFLYAIHRIVGLQKVKPFQKGGRYKVIARFRHHILLYAVISALACAYLIFQLRWALWGLLLIPCLLSLAYVLPFLGKNRRLRDLHYIKIFLIALVWSWLTVVFPIKAQELIIPQQSLWLLFLERTFFVFAITIPFDIRDIQIDRYNEVKTIPAVLGAQRSKWLALVLLSISALFCHFNFMQQVYSISTYTGMLASYLLAAALIYYTDRVKHDYFFTGLLDGTMVFQPLLVYTAFLIY